MSWTKIPYSYVLVLACIATNTLAGPPTCKSGGDWGRLDVTEGIDVCSTANNLLKKCSDSSGNRQDLGQTSSWYTVSVFTDVAECACTKIMYNLLSACAGCQKWQNMTGVQGHKWQSSSVYESSECANYQSGNGSGLQVQPDHHDQAWSDLASKWPGLADGTVFNVTQVLDLTGPGLGTITPPSTTDPVVPTSTTTETPSASATSVAGSKSGPNVGAIAGGVVGGILLLGAILGLLLFLRHRKRRARDVAPSDEFLKPEYYASPPLLPNQSRVNSEYRDDAEDESTSPAIPHRLSWAGGMVTTRRHEHENDDMLPAFTKGSYIGPSPHEKGHPERRDTDESDATATSNTHLLTHSSRPGTSEQA